MPSQDLQRDDKGIRHQVVVHSGVEDLDAAVIRRGGEEGVGGVEVEGADGAGVVPEGGWEMSVVVWKRRQEVVNGRK